MLYPIDKLQPGLILSSDVLNSCNVALLVEGTRLTAQHLQLLKQRGIVAVDVEQASAEEFAPELSSQPVNAFSSEAEQYVNLRFKHVAIQRPELVLVREIAIRRRAELLARNAQTPREGRHDN